MYILHVYTNIYIYIYIYTIQCIYIYIQYIYIIYIYIYIYQNKLGKTCFQHDMAYEYFKDIFKMDINVDLHQQSINCLIKTSKNTVTSATCTANTSTYADTAGTGVVSSAVKFKEQPADKPTIKN